MSVKDNESAAQSICETRKQMSNVSSAHKGSREVDDDELDMERANLISGKDTAGAATSGRNLPDIPLCGFLSLPYYQPYFDVDTTDVITRATQSVLHCRREVNFMQLIGDRPDAYGPVWIATSLVFAISIAAHLHGLFNAWLRGKTW
jgi:hypothetical protein